MKKQLCKLMASVLVTLSVLNFTGCFDLDAGGDEAKNKSDSFDLTGYDGAYVVKLNTTTNDMYGTSTGSISASRSICEDEDTVISKEIGDEEVSGNIPNAFIQKLNEEAFCKLQKDNSRVARNVITKTPQTNDYTVGDTKNFYFYVYETVTDAAGNEVTQEVINQKEAVLKTSGTYCNLWFIDNANTYVTGDVIDFAELAATFDKIYLKEIEILGTNLYTTTPYTNVIDPVKKIDIIVADIMEQASDTLSGGVYGYNNFYDMLSNDTWTNSKGEIIGYTYSNHTQCVYIDSYFYKKDSAAVLSTLAHEFNHLLNNCQKSVVSGLDIDTWYTEMLSLVIEDYFRQFIGISLNGAPYNRLWRFNVYHNYGFENWRTSSQDAVLVSYANAYAFGAYLVRNFGGIDLLKEIAQNEYTGEESITRALQKVTGDSSIDFDYALENSFYTLINTDYTTSSDVYSLNKVAGDTSDSDKLYFEALDITKGCDSDGTLKSYSDDYQPYIYDYGYTPEVLGGKGFFVTSVPSDYSTVTVKYPSDSISITVVGLRE